jgi:hypothetical protein
MFIVFFRITADTAATNIKILGAVNMNYGLPGYVTDQSGRFLL